MEDPFPIYSGSFTKNTKMNATLYVPSGTIETYKATEGWKEFLFVDEIQNAPSGIEPIYSETKEAQRYSLNGLRITSPPKGINIIRYSDGTTKKVIVK